MKSSPQPKNSSIITYSKTQQFNPNLVTTAQVAGVIPIDPGTKMSVIKVTPLLTAPAPRRLAPYVKPAKPLKSGKKISSKKKRMKAKKHSKKTISKSKRKKK